jgi:glycerol-3-phosphate acyltransferase PlsX
MLSIIKHQLKSTVTAMFGAILATGAFKRVKKELDYEETGGAVLLGLKKPIIKAHGSSETKAMKNAILFAAKTVEQGLVSSIQSKL